MSETFEHRLLSIAIERENWELAALCILVSAIERLGWLAPDSVDSLVDVLAAERPPPPRRRGRCRERRR